jgi:hypothetical protein
VTLDEIAAALQARVVAAPAAPVRIECVYAGDRISDLLEQASPTTLLVTNLASRQLLQLADLMDVPAICFLNGHEPEPELLAAAGVRGPGLLVAPGGMFEVCGRLYPRLPCRGGPA